MKNLAVRVVFAIAALSAALLSAAKAEEVKTFSFKGFDKIAISGVYELTVTRDDDFSIELEGSASEMARASVSLSDGTLRLDNLDRKSGGKFSGRRNGVEARVSLPVLRMLEVSGVVDGELVDLDADLLEIRLSGVGDIEASGACDRLEVHVSGVGDLDASRLKCRDVTVHVSGVGSASVFASEVVDAKVSGMGDISVYGSPRQVSKSGGFFADISIK